MGKQKAPVFPLPVSAAIRTSPPPRIRGIASAWTSVGRVHSNSSTARPISGKTPNSVRRKTVQVSERLESTDRRIYINATTLEEQNLCICVSSMGFRIVGQHFDTVNPELEEKSKIYETPYALFTDISPLYVKSFGEALQKAMETLAEGSA
uniref:GSKIP domain-containing protein n=1 Tax=Phlebotomus papatasi TaxID=29031 RepID=A0A1B0DJP7_PHLPP